MSLLPAMSSIMIKKKKPMRLSDRFSLPRSSRVS